MAKTRKPGLVFQPTASKGMQKGINQLLNVIRPTLGPYPRIVAYEKDRNRSPELLDDGGTIARRIIQIPDRSQDVGAMYIRQVLWRVHQKVGDGTATTAVLFQLIFNEGLRAIAAGANAMQLRRHLEAGMQLILETLDTMVVPVSGKEKLAQIAETVCYDPPLARLLGEIFDIIGEHGRLELRTGRGRQLEREYVEGMYWDKGIVSREMITNKERVRTDLENAAILISNLEVNDPRQLVPAMTLAVRQNFKALLIVAKKFSDSTIALLMHEKTRAKLQSVAVTTPGFGLSDQGNALEDLAILTGGRPLLSMAGQSLESVRGEDLGSARRVWADKNHFGLSGGRGDARQLRQHLAQLRAAYKNVDDPEDRKKLQERIGKLLGGSATLWLGGVTKSEIEARKELAQRTAQAVRGAVMEGVLPGGGMALLACRPALEARLAQSETVEERFAYRILLRAIEEPLRTLVGNAGYDPSAVMADLHHAGNGHGFDLRSERIVSLHEAGIFDVATAQKEAVRSAIASAALALTIDVVVQHKKPPESIDP